MTTKTGMLYLCGTPIGNLEDMTFRAVRILQEADLIAAEDTRNSIRLLNHFDIHVPMTSYHEYNKYEKGRVLVKKLLEGQNIVLITDAGMPGISDPGEELVRMCRDAGIGVTAVPGPSACVTALALSGRSTRRFAFEAFLPSDKKERAMVLAELAEETRTIVLYEAPHHLLRTLEELREQIGNRKITICRELTKKYEEAKQSFIDDMIDHYSLNEPKGEFVLVIEGKSFDEKVKEEQESWLELTIAEHLDYYVNRGMNKKEAMKQVAKDRGISKRDVYQADLVR